MVNMKIPESQYEEIVKLYKAGLSTVAIANSYDVTHKTITKILDKYGVKRRNNCHRKYTLNENYFDIIDTPNKAYILGFLYADGSNTESKCTISMSLQEEDGYILEKYVKRLVAKNHLSF